MDTDLFQTLAIVLLAVIALLLVLAYVAIASLKRLLEERIPAGALSSVGAVPSFGQPAQAEPAEDVRPLAETEAAPAARESEARPERAEEPAPAQAAAGATATPAAEQERTEAQQAATAEPEPATTAASQEAQPAAVSASAPRAEREPEPTQQQEVATASADAYPGWEDEPQEQPFEREGRWWFRRGDELLVYDEGTGQWMPAPTSRATLAGVGASPHDEGAAWGAQETSSGFWKCPSCGAVNGSSATSCRMCFSPRPETGVGAQA